MNLKDQIVVALSTTKAGMHVDDIAQAIISKYPNIQFTPEELSRKVSSILAGDIKRNKSESRFSKPKNKRGGRQRGVYRLRLPRGPSVNTTAKFPEQPKVSTQFTGKAGEYSVMSELLFFGFNASSMTVDDGIDVVASKDDSYFHIQVKTSNVTAQGKYQFRLTRKAFGSKDASSTFYVLVMRVTEDGRNTCEHLVLPSSWIRTMVDKGVIRNGETMSISIDRERGKRFVLNNTEDVTWSLNRYDTIK